MLCVSYRQKLIDGRDSSFLPVFPFIIVASLRAPLMVDLDANKHAYMFCSLCVLFVLVFCVCYTNELRLECIGNINGFRLLVAFLRFVVVCYLEANL